VIISIDAEKRFGKIKIKFTIKALKKQGIGELDHTST
jgi:hypothetical protein